MITQNKENIFKLSVYDMNLVYEYYRNTSKETM